MIGTGPLLSYFVLELAPTRLVASSSTKAVPTKLLESLPDGDECKMIPDTCFECEDSKTPNPMLRFGDF